LSLLSSPQGTPDRIWSLIGGLAALGGSASRRDYDALLNPGYVRDGVQVQAKEALAGDTHSAIKSLDITEAVGSGEIKLTIEPPESAQMFADQLHDRLLSPANDSDAVILEAYASLIVACDAEGGAEWIYEKGRNEQANELNKALAGGSGNAMNATKMASWQRWLAFLGLGTAIPLTQETADFPSPARRLARELERAGLAREMVLSASDFAALLAQRMPYLDGGKLFAQACQRRGHSPMAGRFSPLVSAALRDLHDAQVIKLVPSGDAASRLRLTEDPAHPINAFTTVTIFPETGI
jgi:hypothetical protein